MPGVDALFARTSRFLALLKLASFLLPSVFLAVFDWHFTACSHPGGISLASCTVKACCLRLSKREKSLLQKHL